MWTTLNNGRRVRDRQERRERGERRNTGQLGLRARDIMLAGLLLVSVAAVLRCGEMLAAGGVGQSVSRPVRQSISRSVSQFVSWSVG